MFDWSGGGSWYRLVVEIELAVLLVLLVALTVAPQIALGAIAAAATSAEGFSMSYRPVVAIVSLVLAVLTGWGLWSLLRPRGAHVPQA